MSTVNDEMNVSIFLMNDGTTIIGNVVEVPLSGSVHTVENPAYLVMQQEGFQIVPLLDTVGVTPTDITIKIDVSKDLRYGNYARTPDEGLANGYKQTFGYSVIEVPTKQLIL